MGLPPVIIHGIFPFVFSSMLGWWKAPSCGVSNISNWPLAPGFYCRVLSPGTRGEARHDHRSGGAAELFDHGNGAGVRRSACATSKKACWSVRWFQQETSEGVSMGVPLFILHFRLGFSLINHLFLLWRWSDRKNRAATNVAMEVMSAKERGNVTQLNVSKTQMNHTFGHGLYYLVMVIWRMV